MRIDAHVHGMHAERDASGKLVPPMRSVWQPGAMTPQAYVQESRARGVERVLALDPPEVAFELLETFGSDYVMIAPQLDLDVMTPEIIADWFARGACGVKFIAPTKPYNDDVYMPLYDAVRAHGGLAVFHTGYLGWGLFEPGCFLGRQRVADIMHMRPGTIDRIARTFPELKILMAHFGTPWWEEARTMLLHEHRNVYADLSGGITLRRPWVLWNQIFTLDGQLDVQVLEKLCFGTDASLFEPGRFGLTEGHHRFYDELYERLELPDELRARIDRENIQSLVKRPTGVGVTGAGEIEAASRQAEA